MPKTHNHLVVEILLQAARKAGTEATSNHPVDIAEAMINTLEHGAVVIDILNKEGLL